MMLTTILTPLDGSDLSERALPFAARLARGAQRRLLLLRVTSPLGWIRDPETELPVLEALDQLADRLRADGVRVETRVSHAYFVDVGQAICEAAEPRPGGSTARPAAGRPRSLIVMSTRGRGGIGRWLYGSVADEVLRTASTPVLLIPDVVVRPWSDERPLRILVLLDGSTFAEEGLAAAQQLASLVPAELLLLRVVEPPNCGLTFGETPRFEFDAEAETVAARTYLLGLGKTLRLNGASVRTRVAGGFARPTITSIARDERVDLVALATHGRSGLSRLVMGSVATAMLQQLAMPLLLVRPSALRKDGDMPSAVAPADRADEFTTILLSRDEAKVASRALQRLLAAPENEWYQDERLRALLTRLEAPAPRAKTAAGDKSRR